MSFYYKIVDKQFAVQPTGMFVMSDQMISYVIGRHASLLLSLPLP